MTLQVKKWLVKLTSKTNANTYAPGIVGTGTSWIWVLYYHLDNVLLEVIDIEEEGREAEYDKFRYEIPVFFLDKKFLCKNYIDLDKFHSAMKELNEK